MASLTVSNLIDEATGEVNLPVLKGLARRRAMQDYGAITPRSLRVSLRYYGNMIPERVAAWRQNNGLPIETTLITPYGKQTDGLRRSAF